MSARARKCPSVPLPPTREQEEAAFAESLVRQGRAVPGRGPLPAGATHRLIVTPSGSKRVKRKRFSAV